MRKLFAATCAAAVLVLAPGAALADGHQAEVIAVHGIPPSVFDALGADSTEVEVYVAGSYDAPLVTFSFGETGVLPVPPGSYALEVYTAGADPAEAGAVLTLTTPALAAGQSASVVAHLTADGDPTLAAYVNENDATGIQPFHTAAFGPVDVVAGGTPVLEGVANGQTARIDVPGGTTVPGVGIAPAGGEVALPIGDVEVPDSTLVLAYAIGSAEDGSLTVVTATTAVASSEVPAPDAIHAGSGGLASDAMPFWVVALMVLGAVVAGVPVLAGRRR